MELHRSLGAGALCIALCLVSVANSASHPYLTMASGYPGAYQQQLRYQQQPLYYIPDISPRTAAAGAGTPLKYLAVGHPQALPNQRYVITPYMSPTGFLPVAHSQVTALGPQGYQNNNQYLVYPAGTQHLRADQRQLWQNIVNFVSGLPIFNRPNGETPPVEEPGEPQGEAVTAEGVPMGTGEGGSAPLASNMEAPNPQGSIAEGSNAEGSNAEMMKPVASEVIDPNVETIMSPNVEGAEMAQASDMLSRLIARSRAFPRKEGENEEEVVEQEEEKEEEKEEEEEEEDSVVVGPGSTNPSVAQAKPAAIALAGEGGVAAAAPRATAVVGAGGLAVATPSATAVAGPSGGGPPAGLLLKRPKVRPTKISPEEARINAARIQAARQSAYDMIAGLGMGGIPSLPILAYRV